MSKVLPCRDYQGYRNDDGYGLRNLKRFSSKLVHRQIMDMVYGPEAIKGKVVRHTCDRPSCFLFEHLVLGTQLDNMGDMVERGRHASSAVTHCPQGHEYTVDNTCRIKSRPNARYCKACQAVAQRRRRARRKEESV